MANLKTKLPQVGRATCSESHTAIAPPVVCSTDSGGSKNSPNQTPNQDHREDPTLNAPTEIIDLGTTKAGKRRVRRKWTTEENECLMRTYYTITQETSFYRQELHKQITQKYTHLINCTVQNIADQRRSIIKNNLLAQPTLDRLKQEATTPNHHIIHTQPESTPETQSQETPDEESVPMTPNQNNTQQLATEATPTHPITPLHQQITEEFSKTLQEFTHTNPTTRHYIPKQKTSTKLFLIVNFLNQTILPTHITHTTTLEELHTLIYCGAITAARCNGSKTYPPTAKPTSKQTHTHPAAIRLNTKIENTRRDLNILLQHAKGNKSTNKMTRKVNIILGKTNIHTTHEPANKTIHEHIDTLKQHLTRLNKRRRRYKNKLLRQQHNTQFENNQKYFYNTLTEKTQTNTNGLPSTHEIETFWSNIWSIPKQHNTSSTCITHEIHQNEHIQEMPFTNISQTDITQATNKTHNWKSPGVDGIHNYWYKKFTCTHTYLAKHINDILKHPQRTPKFLTQGITYMKPKDTDTKNPAKYRPITCLPTLYKILTSVLTDKIYTHCTNNNILAEQQKGCAKGSMGCKEQLIIDSIITKQAHTKHRNIYTSYIDYKKAFDSVPHTWLTQILEIYKIHPTITRFLQHTMQNWNTTLTINDTNTQLRTQPIQIRRGIFQGDSLSPLWFCLALNPLSNILNNTNYGFNIKHNNTTQTKLTHLLYMDDIKLYASTNTQLEQLLQITESFSKDIHMEFGLDKCRTRHITQGKHEQIGFTLENGDTVKALDETDTYKYLGYHQAQHIEHKHTKTQLKQQFASRIRQILKTHLNGKNTTKAINTYAIPILTYSFGVIKWTQTELTELQRKTRTLFTQYRKHHPTSAIQRITLPRSEGGRGLINILNLHNKQINTLRKYFHDKQESSPLYRSLVQSDTNHTPLNLHNIHNTEPIIEHTQTRQEWRDKVLHGRYPRDLSQEHVDKTASNAWLTQGDLFPETEGFMIAIQDQVINTRNYQKHILKLSIPTDTCRACHQHTETIQHITSSCKTITQTQYKHRHDQVAKIIHQKLAQKYDLTQDNTPYYKYTPTTILESETHKIYWDRAILTDKTIHHNRPDIILQDKTTKTTFLIDIAIPDTHNLQTTHTTKIQKYTDLAMEIRQLWNMDKVIIVPVIISATGVIPKTLHTSLKTLDLPGGTYIQLQKATIINTCHTVRKFLNSDITIHPDPH